ncbi:MAG: pilus assembly protein N-terminal domain-containing protein [Nitratireductor sp.]|nr:pilus assembly protein N-terminal domain-containing protein [Nitratireductor sp.]
MNGSKPHKVPAAALGAAVALVIALALPASVANAAETNGTIPMAMPAGESATMAHIAQPADAAELREPVIVTVDRARVFRVSRPAATVIVGNPSIADATIEDERTLVLTGRSFGVTNLIILDAAGEAIIDQTLVVRGHETNTVRIYRRSSRETLACAPVCEPTLTIGDNSESFAYANEQIKARNELSASGTQ